MGTFIVAIVIVHLSAAVMSIAYHWLMRVVNREPLPWCVFLCVIVLGYLGLEIFFFGFRMLEGLPGIVFVIYDVVFLVKVLLYTRPWLTVES